MNPANQDDQQAAAVLLRFCYADSPAGFANAPPLRAAGSLGGLSGARFWRVVIEGHERVLRRWPSHISADRVRELHTLLTHAAAAGFAGLPCPQAGADGATVVVLNRHCWELADWLPGAPVDEILGDDTAGRVAAGAAALAKLHRATADCPLGRESTGLSDSLAKRLRALQEIAAGSPTDITAADDRLISRQQAAALQAKLPPLAAESLRQVEAAARQPTRLQMIHGDARREHLLFSGDRISGLIDFGAVTYDSPMVDLARWLGETCPSEPQAWLAGVESYNTVRPLTDLERRLTAVLAVSGALIAGRNWLRWAAEGGAPGAQLSDAQARIQQVSRWIDLIAARRHAAFAMP